MVRSMCCSNWTGVCIPDVREIGGRVERTRSCSFLKKGGKCIRSIQGGNWNASGGYVLEPGRKVWWKETVKSKYRGFLNASRMIRVGRKAGPQ